MGSAEAALLVNGSPRSARAGASLRDALREHGIMLPSACGGRGLCGMCRVRTEPLPQPHTEAELKRLTGEERSLGWRLACQVVMEGRVGVFLDEDALAAPAREARAERIEELNYDTRRFSFSLAGEPLRFRAGQFVQLEIPPLEPDGETIYRAYSIASDPADGSTIDLIVRRVPSGRSTTFLHERLRVGDTLKLSGPHGLFGLRPTRAPALFMAGGSGIAPLESMLIDAARNNRSKPITLIFGGVKPDDLYDLERIENIGSGLESFRFIPAISGEDPTGCWQGQKGLVTDVAASLDLDFAALEVYLCGSPGMIGACTERLTGKGVSSSRIYFDRFG